MIVRYPAGGWLKPGTPVNWQRSDQGRDFVIPWQAELQAPGSGWCVENGSDAAFPNGFGPRYAKVMITTGQFATHEWYIGHCTSLLVPGQHFAFGTPVARADQGHDFEGTHGGWVEFGQVQSNGSLGPNNPSGHWFDPMLFNTLNVNVPVLRYGAWGPNIWIFSHRLANMGYLTRGSFHFGIKVHGAVEAFKDHHHLPTPKPDGGIVDAQTWVAIRHAWDHWRLTGRKEA